MGVLTGEINLVKSVDAVKSKPGYITSWAALASNSLFGWNLLRLDQILLLRYQFFLSNWIRKV